MCDVETQIRMLRKKLDVIEYEVNTFLIDKEKELRAKEIGDDVSSVSKWKLVSDWHNKPPKEKLDGLVRQNDSNKNIQKSGPKESSTKANF